MTIHETEIEFLSATATKICDVAAKSHSAPPQGVASQSPTAATRSAIAKKITAADVAPGNVSNTGWPGTRTSAHSARPWQIQRHASTRMKMTRIAPQGVCAADLRG